MKWRLAALLLVLVSLLLWAGKSRKLTACAPLFSLPVFINTSHPDVPILPFTEGNLGIIQPTYEGIYLYVAYRNLKGVRFRASEMGALWDHDPAMLAGTAPMNNGQPLQQSMNQEAASRHNWYLDWGSQSQGLPPISTLPQEFFGIVPWAGVYRQIAQKAEGMQFYYQYLNCPQDAFHQALITLQQRRQEFGANSPVVLEWIKAQRMVFANCSAGSQIPEALPASAPPIARADRAYQIAAALFYAGDYGAARIRFSAIAHDPTSPWHQVAPYLVARTFVRQATIKNRFAPDKQLLGSAEKQAKAALANPRLAEYHPAARRLLGFIEFRLHPRHRLVELAAAMMRPSGNPNLAQDVIDFKRLLNSLPADYAGYSQSAGNSKAGLYYDARSRSDLLDWIATLRAGKASGEAHAFERWQSARSTAWLVAALTLADSSSPHLDQLLAAAAGTRSHSSAYASITFQSLRLQLLQGKREAVRNRLYQLPINRLGALKPGYKTPASALNQFLALRFAVAVNLDELLKASVRTPATVTLSTSRFDLPVAPPLPWEETPAAALGDDAVFVLNRQLPLSVLAQAAVSPAISPKFRRKITLPVWTRALLLQDAAVARRLEPAVRRIEPELRPEIRAYDSASTPEARRFSAALAMLRFPGLRPYITAEDRDDDLQEGDLLRENWWDTGGPPCVYPHYTPLPGQPAFKPPDPVTFWPRITPVIASLYPGGRIPPPEFLRADEREKAGSEWRTLALLGPGQNYLSGVVIAWAKEHPGDPRNPEALARAVRATRVGCTDQTTGGYSKQAFDLLHRRYPKTRWAQLTPYWFK